MNQIEFKDYFSKQSEAYAKHRPTYPTELFSYLASLANSTERALDCATGTGQAALGLAPFFDEVIAIDASQPQIQNASQHPKVKYIVAHAENCPLPSGSVDLLTSASGVHWFNFEKFYSEVKRVLKPGGVIAVWCYNEILEQNEVEALIKEYAEKKVGQYFPKEVQKWVWSRYSNLPFPFKEIDVPSFRLSVEWDLETLLGYLLSWSATQRYIEARGENPLLKIQPTLENALKTRGGKIKRIWPIHLRVGRCVM